MMDSLAAWMTIEQAVSVISLNKDEGVWKGNDHQHHQARHLIHQTGINV